jgi:hypothetical protein
MNGEQNPGSGRPQSGRAAYRSFVRANHPDAGGDPDTFVAGMRRFEITRPGDGSDDRFDAPVVFTARPRGLRGLVRAVLRRRRRPRRVR